MLNQKNIDFINSLPPKNGRELKYLGYTIIDRLDTNELRNLRSETSNMLKNKIDSGSKELFNLINSKTITTKLSSNNIVKKYHSEILESKINTSQIDIYPVAHIFKPFGKKGDIWHQDASIVDERIDFSLNVWTPLVNSNRLNGCIWVFPGSHISEVYFRQFGFNPIQGEIEAIMRKQMIPINVKAGEILLFYRNIVHGSSINYLPKTRIAVESIMVPKQVQFYNYHRDDSILKNSILGYKVDMEHFLRPVPKQDFYDQKYIFEAIPDYGEEWVKNYLLKNIATFRNHALKFNEKIN